jgi:hypothetical protein
VRAALGVDPTPMRAVGFDDYGTAIGLPDGRVLVAVPADRAAATLAALAKHAVAADEPVWRWLAIRAGVAQITLASQERHVPQTANWEVLGGVSFTKGCYPGQEIVARSQHLGILKERAHPFHVAAPPPAPRRRSSAAFGSRPAGASSTRRAARRERRSHRGRAARGRRERDVHVGAPDGHRSSGCAALRAAGERAEAREAVNRPGHRCATSGQRRSPREGPWPPHRRTSSGTGSRATPARRAPRSPR